MSNTKLTNITEVASLTDIDDEAAQSLVGGSGFTTTTFENDFDLLHGPSLTQTNNVYTPGGGATITDIPDVIDITNNEGNAHTFRLIMVDEEDFKIPQGGNNRFVLESGETRRINVPQTADFIHIVHGNTEQTTNRALDQAITNRCNACAILF